MSEFEVIELSPDWGVTAVEIPGTVEGGGGGGGDGVLPFSHTQSVAATVWTITHSLGRYPSAWSLFDNSGQLLDEYQVQHLSFNQLRVSMDVATAGTFRCI